MSYKAFENIQRQIGVDFLKEHTYEQIHDMFQELKNKADKAERELNKLRLANVSQQRELLIAYEKNHYTPQEWALASKQCIEDIDNFLAINCG